MVKRSCQSVYVNIIQDDFPTSETKDEEIETYFPEMEQIVKPYQTAK